MRIISRFGNDDPATVYVGELEDGSFIEMVQSVQHPIPLEDKWVFVISTLKGCPVRCPICDAGIAYRGKLSKEELLDQIRHLITTRFPNGQCKTRRLKIQLARMGEPAFNDAVTELLETLKSDLSIDAVQPSISTVAPFGRNHFFQRLIDLKKHHYSNGWFQMQFSVHTTSTEARRKLIPFRTWSLEQIATFGDRYFERGDLKISLNFAAVRGFPIEPERIARVFSPERFLVKLTPINPTHSALKAGLEGLIDTHDPSASNGLVKRFEALGFDTIVSVGDPEENRIGSNCRMYLSRIEKTEPIVCKKSAISHPS